MYAKLDNGESVWIWWPLQCKLCKGYMFKSDNHRCDNGKTEELIEKLREVGKEFHGVYGSIEFRCDYFCLDEEKYRKTERYIGEAPSEYYRHINVNKNSENEKQ